MEELIRKTKLIAWLARWRWWIIAAVLLALMLFEAWEDQNDPSTLYHILEMGIYLGFLSISGVLVGVLLRSIQNQNKYLQILNTKHKISLDLSLYDDWDELVKQIVKFPASIAPVETSSLYLHNPIAHEFREIAHWEGDGKRSKALPSLEASQVCLARQPGGGYAFTSCEMDKPGESHSRSFCLPVTSGGELTALIRFQIEAGRFLSSDEKFLFENIGDEISAALKAGQDRRVMREISDAEISLNERRKVSYLLHDNLAQNIAYLRLKLGQILSEKDHLSPAVFEDDLESLHNIANDSYDTVRGILETLVPQNLPGFSTTLSELVRKTGQRAHLEIEFQTSGEAVELPVAISQAMLYAFQEILSNIEKHARATRVEIQVQWHEDELVIRFMDNGIGFDPEQVDTARHFGLGILHERIDGVHGQIKISSHKPTGTAVVISTPLYQAHQVKG